MKLIHNPFRNKTKREYINNSLVIFKEKHPIKYIIKTKNGIKFTKWIFDIYYCKYEPKRKIRWCIKTPILTTERCFGYISIGNKYKVMKFYQ